MNRRRPRRPTRMEIINYGLDLLRGGLLPSALPSRLVEAYSVNLEQAGELARETIKRWKRESGNEGLLD